MQRRCLAREGSFNRAAPAMKRARPQKRTKAKKKETAPEVEVRWLKTALDAMNPAALGWRLRVQVFCERKEGWSEGV